MLPELSNMLSVWQWAVLAAIPPAILALYFLKLKRRPLVVPSTYLWHKSVEDLHVNSIWQRLRRNLLLLLQLLVLLMVILAVLRPSWQALQATGSRRVFLIDNSASMQATDVKPSRLEEAKRRVGELIDQMRSGESAMLISFSDTARVEQNFTGDRRRLREALAAIRPSPHATQLGEALKLAAGLVNPGKTGDRRDDLDLGDTKLLIFSDGKFPAVQDFELGNLTPTFVPIGEKDAANMGIVAFGTSRQEEKGGKLQVFARLNNSGPQPATVLLKLYANRQPQEIDADKLDIPAGETRGVAFDLPEFESGVLHLKAETSDALAVDDEAWTVVEPPRRAKVLLVTPKNDRLQQALTTKAAAELADVRVEGPEFLKARAYLDQVDLGAWDLVVYDRAAPANLPRTNTFFIGCRPPSGGWGAKPEVTLPQIIDASLSHRLLQWVDLTEVHYVIEATPLVVPSGGTVLIDSDAGPLLAVAVREGFEDLVLGAKLLEERNKDGVAGTYRNTDWPWRASFASFIYNLLSVRAGRLDPSAANSCRPGTAVTLQSPNLREGLEVESPSGQTTQLPANPTGRLSFTVTDELGVYRVRAGGKTLHEFAVNLLDPAESDIRLAAEPKIKIGYVDVAGKTGWQAGHREIWRELVLIGLGIALVEWLVYLRRVYF